MKCVKNKFDCKGNMTDSKKEMGRECNRITEITTIDLTFKFLLLFCIPVWT